MPILVDEKGEVIAGHGQLLAAKRNNFTEYPVVIAKAGRRRGKSAARIRDKDRNNIAVGLRNCCG